MHLSETITSGFLFLAPWLVFFPVLGLLVNAIFGRRFSENMIGTVASLASGAAFVVSILLAYSVSINQGEVLRWRLAEWIHVGSLSLDWTFRVDSLSATMMLVVSGVGTLIHIYAIGYMHEDVRFKNDVGRFRRFFIYLNLFIAAMMILVSGDSYLMLFVGWEGVGLCSFLLIGFWFEMDTLARPSWANSDAAKKAFIANRIGDFGFLIAAFLIFWNLGNTFQFDAVFEAAKSASPGILLAITLFLLIGVAGKSAQIPLYVWLPDAMAGPTPVSALIHAATMVTAGVYLITRSAPLYSLSPDAQYVVAMTGAITAFFAATIAVGQYDIKKVLAYSTISQLGFMVAAVGMGSYVAGIFPFAGFWSKDEILLDASLHYPIVYILLTVAAFFTAFYMGRQIWMVFFGEARTDAAAHAEESPKVMTVPLMILAVLSILGGALNLPTIRQYVLPGSHMLTEWLGHTLGEVENGTLNEMVAGVSFGLALLAIFISWLIYGRRSLKVNQPDPLKKMLGPIFIGMESKWLIDEVYLALIINPLTRLSYFLADVIDWRFWHDFFHETVIAGTYNWFSGIALDRYADQRGIDGFANWLGTATQWVSGVLRKIQNGFVRSYALSVLLGVVIILGYLILK